MKTGTGSQFPLSNQRLDLWFCWHWMRGCCCCIIQPGVLSLPCTHWLITSRVLANNRGDLTNGVGAVLNQMVLDVKKVEQGTQHAVLWCTCVDGLWEGDVVTYVHWLVSGGGDAKKQVAMGGIEAQILELGNEFGGVDCVTRQPVVDTATWCMYSNYPDGPEQDGE